MRAGRCGLWEGVRTRDMFPDPSTHSFPPPPPHDRPDERAGREAGKARMPRPRPWLRTLAVGLLIAAGALFSAGEVGAWRIPQPPPPPPPITSTTTTSSNCNTRRSVLQQQLAASLGLLLCAAAATTAPPTAAAAVQQGTGTAVILGGYRIPAEQYRGYEERLKVRLRFCMHE